MRMLVNAAAGALAFCVFTGAAGTAHAAAPACDRDCLKKTLDTYLAALVAHDPAKAPLAANVVFVENAARLAPGEGLWKDASEAPKTFRIYVPDPVSQQVGFIGVMKQAGRPIEVALRLALEDGKITEAEHLIAAPREASLPNLQAARPAFAAVVPPAQRTSRDEMLRLGLGYYDALVKGDPGATAFADDCVRRENGIQTTGNPLAQGADQSAGASVGPGGMAVLGTMGCANQLRTHAFDYIKRIDNRRVAIADVENGLVMGFAHLRQPMNEKLVKIVGVPGVEKVDLNIEAFDLPAAHVFKVSGGRIHEIESVGVSAPYNSATGWE